jgi:hypothetical protein
VGYHGPLEEHKILDGSSTHDGDMKYKVKLKISLLQAVGAHRIARG